MEAGSRVSGNTATLGGGGIHSASGTLTLAEGSRVTGNTTAHSGGGILIENFGTVILEPDSRVTGNTATNNGGGIFNQGDPVTVPGNAFVCDNLPTDNQCAGSGGFNGDCPNPETGICPT